ncbi:MAG: hypothetical protein LBE11_07755 [Prevotellaceae bacterium]|jgi:hypothetical protein|nr:hypothetical protein [Prevotellaceae bacterium]
MNQIEIDQAYAEYQKKIKEVFAERDRKLKEAWAEYERKRKISDAHKECQKKGEKTTVTKDPCIDCPKKQFMCLCIDKRTWDDENLPLPKDGIRYWI